MPDQSLEPGGAPSPEDVKRARRAFAERLLGLRQLLGMSRRELEHVTGKEQSTIAGYENTEGKSRIPHPDFVFKLLDEVARYTTEHDINARGASDTLDIYANLLRLLVTVQPRSHYYETLLKAWEDETQLRAAREELTRKQAEQNSLLELRERGVDVSEADLERVGTDIERVRERLPHLAASARETAAAILRTPVPLEEQEPPTERVPAEQTLRRDTAQTPLGPLQNALPPASTPPGGRASSRFVIVAVLAAVVVIALGMTLILRLTGNDNGTAQAAGPTGERADSSATATASRTSQNPIPKKAQAPSSTPSTSPSSTPTLLDQAPFEYDKTSGIYIGVRGTDFDTKPPLDGLKTESYPDLNTLRMEGQGVVLERTLDAQRLVKTRPGFTASYASCTQLMDQSLGNQNIAAQTGDSFCFDTNQQRIAFITITKALPTAIDRDNRVIVDATVWEDPKTVQTDRG